MFQSTHLHEVWHCLPDDLYNRYMFQSTHLHEVWLLQLLLFKIILSFNPHTYMWCDRRLLFELLLLIVSIHTPTWGVTCPFSVTHQCLIVSIHTPTWGVTKLTMDALNLQQFQSTHLHEVWLYNSWLHNNRTGFNPHTYMRCDRVMPVLASAFDKFQSTHLHEVWPYAG